MSSDKQRAAARKSYHKLKLERPTQNMWRNAKIRARQRGWDFNIEISDIVVPDFCPILEIPLFFSQQQPTGNSPSLDRVDTTKGYIKGNVRVISYRANTIKSDLTVEQLKRLVEYMSPSQ